MPVTVPSCQIICWAPPASAMSASSTALVTMAVIDGIVNPRP